jgi:hypothetical protein
MPCGVRAAQGKAPGAAGLASSEVRSQSRSRRFPGDPPPASGHALPQRAPNVCRLGSARPGVASAGIAVSGAGQPRPPGRGAARGPRAVPAATARKTISAMSRWMRPLPGHRGARSEG